MLKYAIQEWATKYPEVLSAAFVGFLVVGDPTVLDLCAEMIGIERNCGYPGP